MHSTKTELETALNEEKTEHGAMSHFTPFAIVQALEVPVLLVHGERDTVVPPTDTQRLASAARGATLLVVPGAGHANAPDRGSSIGCCAT